MVAIISGLVSAGCSVFGIRTEAMPPYTVERSIGAENEVELRRYGPRLVAETTVDGTEAEARNQGFRRLAGYIFGGNQGGVSIDMTAPVAQSRGGTKGEAIEMTAPVAQARSGTGWRIRFFMPAKFTEATLPRPNDPAVTIATAPAETVAVLRYSGSIAPGAVHAREQALLSVVAAAGLRPSSAPFSWFYDPPWTLPPLRRNEAVVAIAPG